MRRGEERRGEEDSQLSTLDVGRDNRSYEDISGTGSESRSFLLDGTTSINQRIYSFNVVISTETPAVKRLISVSLPLNVLCRSLPIFPPKTTHCLIVLFIDLIYASLP